MVSVCVSNSATAYSGCRFVWIHRALINTIRCPVIVAVCVHISNAAAAKTGRSLIWVAWAVFLAVQSSVVVSVYISKAAAADVWVNLVRIVRTEVTVRSASRLTTAGSWLIYLDRSERPGYITAVRFAIQIFAGLQQAVISSVKGLCRDIVG